MCTQSFFFIYLSLKRQLLSYWWSEQLYMWSFFQTKDRLKKLYQISVFSVLFFLTLVWLRSVLNFLYRFIYSVISYFNNFIQDALIAWREEKTSPQQSGLVCFSLLLFIFSYTGIWTCFILPIYCSLLDINSNSSFE